MIPRSVHELARSAEALLKGGSVAEFLNAGYEIIRENRDYLKCVGKLDELNRQIGIIEDIYSTREVAGAQLQYQDSMMIFEAAKQIRKLVIDS